MRRHARLDRLDCAGGSLLRSRTGRNVTAVYPEKWPNSPAC